MILARATLPGFPNKAWTVFSTSRIIFTLYSTIRVNRKDLLVSQPSPTATTQPVRTIRDWVQVRCPACGKLLCEILPGSTVRVTCRRCKQQVVRQAA
jgi:hypothetical protein